LGSFLFFFFGSLSYVPFLHRQGSVRAAIQAIRQQREFLPTIFPYRGEQWGTWSQVTYLNQRHFASAIGILLLVLIFLVIRYRMRPKKRPKPPPPPVPPNLSPEITADTGSENRTRSETILEPNSDITSPSPEPIAAQTNPSSEIVADTPSNEVAPTESPSEPEPVMPAVVSVATEPEEEPVVPAERFRNMLTGFIFSGVLLGILPMWNSAVFIGAAAVLGVLFILFPLRVQMLALAVTTGLLALPQMLYLTGGSGRTPMPRLFHWGYTLDQPTAMNVAKYLGFTFGFKWLLIALALLFATNLQRRFFLAASSLLAVAFCC